MTILRDYLTGEILPHAKAEEGTLYRAAATQARGSELVRELTGEHHALVYLAGRLRAGADGSQAATAAEWIATLFAGHVAKVNDLLLPALIGSGTDFTALLAGMRAPQASARALRHWHRPLKEGRTSWTRTQRCQPGSSPSWRWWSSPR